jgi:endonuclease III
MGEGGAYRMLLFAADHPVLPVDARLARVVGRLGFVAEEKDFARTARSIRKALGALLPPDADTYRRTYLYLSHHGATTCTEASPHCAVCPLRGECPTAILMPRAGR